jgi:hypothetical protein
MPKVYLTKPSIDLLRTKKKHELSILASYLNVKGRSNLKKNDLIDVIETEILSSAEFNVLKFLPIEFFNIIDTNKEVIELPQEYIDYFYSFCLLTEIEGKYYLPNDMTFIADNTPILQNLIQVIHTYLPVAINLYGMISVDNFFEMIRYYDSDKEMLVGFENFVIYRILRELESFYSYEMLNKNQSLHIVSETLIDYDFVELMMHHQKDKSFYYPDKEELSFFKEKVFFKETALFKQVVKYFKEYSTFPTFEVENEVKLLFDVFRKLDININAMLESVSKHFNLKDEDDANALLQQLVFINNESRRWLNRGYKAVEISRFVKQNKVGRNDPCPCGSGKKYKKCCGR